MTRATLCGTVAALALLSSPALALEDPQPCAQGEGADPRVRCIAPRTAGVARLVAAPGATMLVEVPDGERVLAVPVSDDALMRAPGPRSVRLPMDDGSSSGDDRPTTDGNLSVSVRGTTVILKPHGPLVAQPFFVLTERDGKTQRYAFQLETGANWFYSVRLRNPEAEAAERRVRAAKAAERREERAARDQLAQAEAEPCRSIPNANRRYVGQGDAALAPAEVCDDGRKTYMRFSGRIPVISTTLPDGRLAAVNTAVGRNGWHSIEGTARTFQLADGGRTLCIHNRDFRNEIATTGTGTGTVSSGVVRELR